MLIYRKKSLEDLGKKLKSMRMELGLSVNEFANKNGISASTISRIENGLINPKLSMLTKLALAFDTTVGELVAGVEYAEEVDDSWDRWQDY